MAEKVKDHTAGIFLDQFMAYWFIFNWFKIKISPVDIPSSLPLSVQTKKYWKKTDRSAWNWKLFDGLLRTSCVTL